MYNCQGRLRVDTLPCEIRQPRWKDGREQDSCRRIEKQMLEETNEDDYDEEGKESEEQKGSGNKEEGSCTEASN